MTSQARADPGAARSEEWQAARGVLVAVTAGTGGMLTLFGVAAGAPPFAVLPTMALIAGVWRAWPDRVLGWAGVAIWAMIVPSAHGEGLLAPLIMVVAWLAVAIGPDRLRDWIATDWNGRERPTPLSAGWIEDDVSVR
jgi:hypothetical protein